MRVDPLRYDISEPHYISRGDYWSVTYYLMANKRVACKVRVSDKVQEATIEDGDAGIFEGALTDKNNLH